MLTDVRGDESFALGHLVELLDDELRLDDRAGTVIFEAIPFAPQADLLPPGLQSFLVGAAARGLNLLDQFFQHIAHVANHGDIDFHPFGNGCRIDIDMYDRAWLFEKMLGIADHPVIEPRADRQQHVTVLHRHVGFVGSMHAQHAQEQLVCCRISTQPHQRVGARKTGQLYQFSQLGRSIPQYHATARVNHRALGFQQQLHRLLDLTGMSLDHRIVGTHCDGFRIIEFRLGRRYVLGNVDHHRTGATRRRDVERLLDRDCQIFDVLHQKIVLHAGTRDADRVAFLERIFADGMRGHLPGQYHHRDRIHVSRGNAGHGIGYTRARGDERNADFFRRARIGIGRMYRRLFMAYQHMLHLVLLEQLVIQKKNSPARIAEYVADTFFLQTTYNDLCTRQLHDFVPARAGTPGAGSLRKGNVQHYPAEPYRSSKLSL